MTLRVRISLVIAVAVAVLAVAVVAVLDTVLTRDFGALERAEAEHRAAQVGRAVVHESATLDGVLSDYASWDEMYAYVARPTAAFIASNLSDQSLVRLRLGLFAITDHEGAIVWGRSRPAGAEHTQPLPRAWLDRLTPASRLVRHLKPSSHLHGIVMVGDEAWLVASRPITTSANRGPLRGAVIMARRLAGEIAGLRETTALDLYLETRPGIAPVTIQSDTQLTAHAVIKDIDRREAVGLAVRLPREMDQHRRRAQATLLAALLLTALGFAVVTLRTTEQYVLRRIVAIARFVRTVRIRGDLALRLEDESRDEIGEVTTALNDLLATLDTQTRDLEQARVEALQRAG